MDKKQKLMKLKSYRNLLLIIKEYNNAYNTEAETKEKAKVKVLTKKFYGKYLVVG